MSTIKHKKITDDIKSTSSYKFAIIKSLTSRESARFSSLFNDDQDFANASQSKFQVLGVYVRLAQEPNLRQTHNLEKLNTRSKVVIAYELQRKCFLKIAELRLKNPALVDSIVHTFAMSFDNSEMTVRQQVLQHILRNI